MNSRTSAPFTAQPASTLPVQAESLSLPARHSFWDDFSPEDRCKMKLQTLSLVIDSVTEYLHDSLHGEQYATELGEVLGIAFLDYQEALNEVQQKGGAA
jgi:hypothetical protein